MDGNSSVYAWQKMGIYGLKEHRCCDEEKKERLSTTRLNTNLSDVDPCMSTRYVS